MLTDNRERFIKFADVPPEDSSEILCAYDLTPFTGKKDHWVVALYDEDNGAYVSTWCGDDWRADPLWEYSRSESCRAEAHAVAYGYARALWDAKP